MQRMTPAARVAANIEDVWQRAATPRHSTTGGCSVFARAQTPSAGRSCPTAGPNAHVICDAKRAGIFNSAGVVCRQVCARAGAAASLTCKVCLQVGARIEGLQCIRCARTPLRRTGSVARCPFVAFDGDDTGAQRRQRRRRTGPRVARLCEAVVPHRVHVRVLVHRAALRVTTHAAAEVERAAPVARARHGGRPQHVLPGTAGDLRAACLAARHAVLKLTAAARRLPEDTRRGTL